MDSPEIQAAAAALKALAEKLRDDHGAWVTLQIGAFAYTGVETAEVSYLAIVGMDGGSVRSMESLQDSIDQSIAGKEREEEDA